MPFTPARVTAAIAAAGADTTHMQLHTGAPGANGTSNIAAAVDGRVPFVFPAAVDGETEQTADVPITGASPAITYATGWNAASNGVLQWTAELTPAESFAGAGTLQVTITATGETE